MKKLTNIYGLNEDVAQEAIGDEVTITFTKNEIATLISIAQRSHSVPGVQELRMKIMDAAKQGGGAGDTPFSSSASSRSSIGGLKLQ